LLPQSSYNTFKTRARSMPRRRKTADSENKPIEQYTHKDKDRVNIPPVGLVTPETDQEGARQRY
jgi:hypothetical protein